MTNRIRVDMNKDTCTVEGCEKEAKASRGWCWLHYNHWRRQGDPLAKFTQTKCSLEGCDSAARAGGMCDLHYRRMKRHGDPSKGRPVYEPICSVDSCDQPSHSVGLCTAHYYQRWAYEGNGLALNAATQARRRARMAGAVRIDATLSWRSLWAEGLRDCYLCGIQCNPEDLTFITNRAGREQMIPGRKYPTIDHVIALANGGTHTRDNAGLACAECNWRKHSKAGYVPTQHVTA